MIQTETGSVANYTLFGVDLRFFYCLLSTVYVFAFLSIALFLRFCALSDNQCWQIYAFLLSKAANLP